jgi:Phage portal protein
MATWLKRLAHAWNAFSNRDAIVESSFRPIGPSYSYRPDRPRTTFTNERSIIASIYTRIAVDVASIDIRHVRLDEDGRYSDNIVSGLNNCLTVEANVDQAASQFRQSIVSMMLNNGVAAVVPVDTTISPVETGGYDIQTLRVGEIVEWFPYHVRVRLYREQTAQLEDITLEKKFVAIVENPLYDVMNKPNSTLQRLIRKLNMLDAVDEQSSSGKLDMIIQLPYVIKSESRRDQAIQRRTDIETQLRGSQYGIAYIDGTEKITQLNRPAENNLLKQIEYLTNMLYSQLGITASVMNGDADEAAMLNYNNRTVEPILRAIVEGMRRTFLTKTARTQNQSILYFRDPFKLVPIAQVAEIADKFTRNEIASANDIRVAIGWRPSKDAKADQLKNANMPQQDTTGASSAPVPDPQPSIAQDSIMKDLFDGITSDIDAILGKSGSG